MLQRTEWLPKLGKAGTKWSGGETLGQTLTRRGYLNISQESAESLGYDAADLIPQWFPNPNTLNPKPYQAWAVVLRGSKTWLVNDWETHHHRTNGRTRMERWLAIFATGATMLFGAMFTSIVTNDVSDIRRVRRTQKEVPFGRPGGLGSCNFNQGVLQMFHGFQIGYSDNAWFWNCQKISDNVGLGIQKKMRNCSW